MKYNYYFGTKIYHDDDLKNLEYLNNCKIGIENYFYFQSNEF